MNRPLVLALIATLALASTAAVATPTASVQLTDFQFRLVDLDPEDGIAPSIDLSAYGGSRVYAGTSTDVGSSALGPALATFNGPDGLFELASITDDLAAGGSAATLATVSDFPGRYPSAQSTIVLGASDGSAFFTLSPHTELVMSGTVDASSTTSQVGGFFEFAQCAVDFGLSPATGVFDYRFVDVFADNGLNQSQHADLSLALANTTDASMQGGFFVLMSSLVELSPDVGPAPVPEPGTAALTLAALAGMAMTARRRRRPD